MNDCEKIQVLFENEKIKVEHIYSFGNITKEDFWYDQNDDEYVAILKGYGELTLYNNKIIPLSSGQSFYIEKHLLHRVSKTSIDCEWLCVYIKEKL